MAEIPSIGHGSVGPINRAAPMSAYQATERASRNGETVAGDRVELSQHAVLLDRLRHLPDVRTDLVNDVSTAIRDGTYETDEKLIAAAARLLEDLQV